MKRCLVVMYHYVRNMQDTNYPEIKGLLIDKFRKQVDYLKEKYTIISLSQYSKYLNGEGDIPNNSCILSFDDGLKDHYENVFPILKERNVPGCFFVATKPLVDNSVLPVQKIQFLLAKAGTEKLTKSFNSILEKEHPSLFEKHRIDDIKHSDRKDWYDEWDTTLTSNLKYCIASLPWKIKDIVVDELFLEYFKNEKEFSKELYLNWDEIKEMIGGGMEFGTHSHSHPDLSKLSKEDIFYELKTSKEIMEENLGVKINLCSYPYGILPEESISDLKKIGLSCALIYTGGKMNEGKVNPFKIGRFDTNEVSVEGAICPICNKNNAVNENFCKYCRYPLGVKKINEFNDKDTFVHLSSLLEITKKGKLFENDELNRLYDELFSLYWLRPETALFSFMEASLISKFKGNYLKYPVLDLGCGDGMFSAIAFGSKINKKYDNFEIIDFNKTDPYDSYEKLPSDFFVSRCDKIGYGLDIKENSVKRSKDLKIYDDVKTGDIRELPFKDKSVSSVYSNMLDDVKTKDLGKVFSEAHRVLKENGYFVFTSPTENFKDFLFYCNKAKEFEIIGDSENSKLYMKYNRGRSEWESRSLEFWKKILSENSFELIEYIQYADDDFLKFWDIGLRPFFKDTLNFKNIMRTKGILNPFKGIFVDAMKSYLHKYVKEPFGGKGSFSMIVAKKNV
jgi:peptidoglycan/xylan/chitin deacetylase (PgdA/CDA1 family)/SAM-dependent methyltransferase